MNWSWSNAAATASSLFQQHFQHQRRGVHTFKPLLPHQQQQQKGRTGSPSSAAGTGAAATAAPAAEAVHNIPSQFAAERAGSPDPTVVRELPKFEATMRSLAYVPPAEEFWRLPAFSVLGGSEGEAGNAAPSGLKYPELARLASENSWFHLFADMLIAEDAPLPHTVYEDCMQALTFSSLQRRPEKHFALRPSLQRAILCRAAHFLVLDKNYFGTVQQLFRLMEQQQSVGSEAWSAWVMCCLAANQQEEALDALIMMKEAGVPFDPVVFSVIMSPNAADRLQALPGGPSGRTTPESTRTTATPAAPLPHSVKGLLQQQRLATGMANACDGCPIALGVHAGFVFYAVTLRKHEKWEWMRLALQLQRNTSNNSAEVQRERAHHTSLYSGREVNKQGTYHMMRTAIQFEVSERTRHLLFAAFQREKGQWVGKGPQTLRSLAQLFAHKGEIHRVLTVLVTARQQQHKFAQQMAAVGSGGAGANSKHTATMPNVFNQNYDPDPSRRSFQDGGGGDNNNSNNKTMFEQEAEELVALCVRRNPTEAKKHMPILKKLLSLPTSEAIGGENQQQLKPLSSSSSSKSDRADDRDHKLYFNVGKKKQQVSSVAPASSSSTATSTVSTPTKTEDVSSSNTSSPSPGTSSQRSPTPASPVSSSPPASSSSTDTPPAHAQDNVSNVRTPPVPSRGSTSSSSGSVTPSTLSRSRNDTTGTSGSIRTNSTSNSSSSGPLAFERTPDGHVAVLTAGSPLEKRTILHQSEHGEFESSLAFAAAVDVRRRAREQLAEMRKQCDSRGVENRKNVGGLWSCPG